MGGSGGGEVDGWAEGGLGRAAMWGSALIKVHCGGNWASPRIMLGGVAITNDHLKGAAGGLNGGAFFASIPQIIKMRCLDFQNI